MSVAPSLASWHLDGHVGLITMHHNAERNCLSTAMVANLIAAIDSLETRDCRVIILRAEPGATVWSAGHNIKEITLDGKDPLGWNTPFLQLLRRIRETDLPVIGMLEGSVWGAACDLAVSMDILVGTPSVTFAMTPARLGLPYNTAGLAHFIGVLPLHIIKEMLFTARPLSAEDAYRLGLLNHLVPGDELQACTCGIAAEIASSAPLAVKLLKRELNEMTRSPVLPVESYERIQMLRESAYHSEDLQNGLAAFLSKSPPRFNGR